MIDDLILQAFGLHTHVEVRTLATGLINSSFRIETPNGLAYLLQQINTTIFPEPDLIQNNYAAIRAFLQQKESYDLPAIKPTEDGKLFFENEGKSWRCFLFVPDSYSPLTADTADEAYMVARCFGKFSADLSDMDVKKIATILPGFHDLSLRFDQFQAALQTASDERRRYAKPLIEKVEKNIYLLEWFKKAQKDKLNFPEHILHHDCKIANMLFDSKTQQLICPIDLDTTQPGLFFSDMGDMIRSMTPNMGETATDLDNLELRGDFYEGIKAGYLESMGDKLTLAEMKYLDISGNFIIYMQALRFITDYLNNDQYYRIEYPEQNKDRSANQFRLLELLDQYQKILVK